MSITVNGYEVNEFRDPAPWAVKETANFTTLFNMMPTKGTALVDGSLVPNPHKHSKLFDELEAQQIEVTSTGTIIGTGITIPDSILHIYKGSAGVVTASAGTTLTIENNTNSMLSFLVPNANYCGFYFGDTNNNSMAYLYYNHNDDTFRANQSFLTTITNISGTNDQVGYGLSMTYNDALGLISNDAFGEKIETLFTHMDIVQNSFNIYSKATYNNANAGVQGNVYGIYNEIFGGGAPILGDMYGFYTYLNNVNPSGSKFGIYSRITGTGTASTLSHLYCYNSANTKLVARIDGYGKMCIGMDDTPTTIAYDFVIGGDSSKQISLARRTTDASGSNLTISAGHAFSSGSDKNGGNLILVPGTSTGTGTSNTIIKRMDRNLSTSAVDNSSTDAIIVSSPKTINDNSTTDLFDVSITTLTGCGGFLFYNIYASDGVDAQCFSGYVAYSAVNKGGVCTTSIAIIPNASGGEQTACSGATTLTNNNFTINTGANKITIRCNFNTSLTIHANDYFEITYVLYNNSRNAVTIL